MFKRSVFLVTAAMVALAAAGSAAAMVRVDAGPAPTVATGTQPTAQETKANLARAEYLNQKYHLGAYAASGQTFQALGEALNARYGNAWTRMSSTKFSTLVKTFGNDITLLTPQQLRTLVACWGTRVAEPSSSGNGFDWGDAGIGTLGAVAILLGLGAVIAVYVRSHRPQPKFEGAHSAA